jgi:maltooligosyltrehalose trehalohydrolase
LRAKLNHELKSRPRHRELLDWYRELLNLRRRVPALAHHDKERQDVVGLAGPKVLLVHRGCGPGQTVLILAFSKQAEHATLPVHAGIWEKVLGEGGPARLESTGEISLDLHPRSVLVYVRAAGR